MKSCRHSIGLSLPLRGAWIEYSLQWISRLRSLPLRGAWIENTGNVLDDAQSLLCGERGLNYAPGSMSVEERHAFGTWISFEGRQGCFREFCSRSLCGERGLKCILLFSPFFACSVAPFAGSGGLKFALIYIGAILIVVAPFAGSVD